MQAHLSLKRGYEQGCMINGTFIYRGNNSSISYSKFLLINARIYVKKKKKNTRYFSRVEVHQVHNF